MGKRGSRGQLKIKDDNSGPHHKKAIFNVKSKNKKSPQPKASLKADNIEDLMKPWHDHSKCIEEQQAAARMRTNFSMEELCSQLEKQFPQDGWISISDQIEVPASPERPLVLDLDSDCSGELEWSSPSPPRTPRRFIADLYARYKDFP